MKSKRFIIKKPWGHEEIVFRGNGVQVKKLVIKAGKRLSLQYHNEKVESVTVLKGTAFLDVGGMNQREIVGIVQINQKTIHRFSSDTGATLLEMSIGSDSDIVRLEDDHGRAK